MLKIKLLVDEILTGSFRQHERLKTFPFMLDQ